MTQRFNNAAAAITTKFLSAGDSPGAGGSFIAHIKILIFTFALMPMILSAGVEGIVTANRLNLRVKPGTKYTLVAQVKKGDKLEVVKHENGWYQVIAPENAKVWVSAAFVDGGIIKKPVHLRSGPSVAFSSYRLAEPGETVKVLDKSRKDWLQIAPPSGLTAWVSAQYVFLTPENAAKLTEKPLVKKDALKDKKDIAKKEDKKSQKAEADILPFINSNGKIVTVEGYLVALRKDAKYVTHAIAAKINGDYFPLCYVHSDTHNLNLWKGRRVNITGKQRWVKGWQRPVVDLTKITPTM
jgi:uncharacterized protein YgiM (DUF1202 family)